MCDQSIGNTLLINIFRSSFKYCFLGILGGRGRYWMPQKDTGFYKKYMFIFLDLHKGLKSNKRHNCSFSLISLLPCRVIGIQIHRIKFSVLNKGSESYKCHDSFLSHLSLISSYVIEIKIHIRFPILHLFLLLVIGIELHRIRFSVLNKGLERYKCHDSFLCHLSLISYVVEIKIHKRVPILQNA